VNRFSARVVKGFGHLRAAGHPGCQ